MIDDVLTPGQQKTGWGSLWDVNPGRYAKSEPGIDESAAHWLTARRVAVMGANSWAVERVTSDPDPAGLAFPVHQETIIRNGTYVVENLRLDSLARDKVTTFLAMIAPVRLRGGTGSMVNHAALT